MSTYQETNLVALPGYELIEQIGTGGYGEVWRATAPGGLEKAVKFVFGTETEKRATHERKALKRIKELRHPFLLSLERIEVVNDRLVIVTELAEGSLKDRFDQCRQEGMHGIPREELLGYLRDAADALDFMSDKHELQHLDIKPENLLMVGDHVKVADFGLVKDISNTQASIVGGMTPLYSAPEVFRGQPTSHSDQYSLAILYQEMLTGQLPFAGPTAAELTLQHLNDEPDLGMLAGADRYAVSRALSKNPDHRYESSRAFIETMIRAVNVGIDTGAAPAPQSESTVTTLSAGGPSRTTQVFDEEIVSEAAEPMLIDFPGLDAQEIHSLPAIDFEATDFSTCPTLFLGVGGTGGKILNQLRRQICEKFGSMDAIPTCRMLLLDSDPGALAEIVRSDSDGFTPDETLAIPLHRAQHYRENASMLLKWLSRRWLYNIPKSMRTEGLRPLGRLALVDHARQVCQRIRQAISMASEEDSQTKTAETLAAPVNGNACRVYLVGSISGGTGGGMLLDLTYALRALLDKLEIEDSEIIAILTHSTGRDQRNRDLAKVSAYSWLNEYQHFLQPNNSYPGEASCGFPAHEAGVKPFNHTYFVHLGEKLTKQDYNRALATVADYLYYSTWTGAKTVFDACRRQESTSVLPTVRSFGLHCESAAPSEFCEEFAARVCETLVQTWQRDNNSDPTEPGSAAADLIGHLKLESTGLSQHARILIDGALGNDLSKFLKNHLDSSIAEHELKFDGKVIGLIDQLFRRDEESEQQDGPLLIAGKPLTGTVAPLEEMLREELNAWLAGRLNNPGARLSEAKKATEWLSQHLEAVQSDAAKEEDSTKERLLQIRKEATIELEPDPSPRDPQAEFELALQYLQVRLEHCASITVTSLCNAILADTREYLDQLNILQRELKQVGESCNRQAFMNDESYAEYSSALEERLSEICTRVDHRVQAEYIDISGGLMEVVMSGGRTRAQLIASLLASARQAVDEVLNDEDVLSKLMTDSHSGEFNERLVQAQPLLLKHGGSKRVITILPKQMPSTLSGEEIGELLGEEVTTVQVEDNSVSLCVEAHDLPLAQVAVHLIERRRDYLEFAERVHSRSDISWTNITDLLTEEPVFSEPVACPDSDFTTQLVN